MNLTHVINAHCILLSLSWTGCYTLSYVCFRMFPWLLRTELPTSTEFLYFVWKFAQYSAVWACRNKYGILKNNHTERSKTMNPDKHAKTHSFTPNPGAIVSGPHTHALTFKQRSAGAAMNAWHVGQVVALLPCIQCMHTVRALVQCMRTITRSMYAHETTDQNLRWRCPLQPF